MALAALVVLAAVVALVAWRRVRRPTSATAEGRSEPIVRTQPPALSVALRGEDLGVIAQALVAEGGRDLDALCAALADPAQVAAVRALQAARWGDGDPQAAVRQLRTAFAGGLRRKHAGHGTTSVLPPLYPES